LTPRRALEPQARYTLVVGPALRVGGTPLGRAVVRAFSTGDASAPVVTLIDPEDGAAGVVRNLRAVHFVAMSAVSLVDDAGMSVASHSSDPGTLLLDEPLAANAHYALVADGAFGDPPGFSTGSELRTAAPALTGVELESADRCFVARLVSDRAASASLCIADRCASDGPSLEHELGLPLAGASAWSLSAGDESTAPAAMRAGQASPPPLPIVITEVLTDPRGPRLRQQFVELTNLGDAAAALGGLVLKTASGADPLPPSTLPPHGNPIVVTRDFADDGVDPSPAPSAVIVKLDVGRLGGAGLHVDGEPVWIETASGTLITRWGGWPIAHDRGQSFHRTTPLACDVRASFSTGPPTPGGP
jgi:hypothetical protein